MEKKGFFVQTENLEYDYSEIGLTKTILEPVASDQISTTFFLQLSKEQEIYLPASIFHVDLTPFQVIIKYLKENRKLKNAQISKLINRDVKTIWTTYHKIDHKKSLKMSISEVQIPLSIFKNNRLSHLESLVLFLKQEKYRFVEISRLIGRDQRTIWTINARIAKKMIIRPQNE